MFAEPVVPGRDAKARKHLLPTHGLGPFQVMDSFVDGLHQPPRPGDNPFEDLPVRPEGRNLLEARIRGDI